MSFFHIDALIRRSIQLDLIRIDNDLPNQLDRRYVQGLKDVATLLERIRHGLTIRKMMYDHAEICQTPLEEQVELYPSDGRGVSRHERIQHRGLSQLETSSQELPSGQQDTLHNPNIIVNCDSGTEGELGCAEGYIKVYQAVYCASYGANNYKDVYEHDIRGRKQLVIQPATGGKCNVSIGNPFRIVGWYLNYMNQGSTAPLIRMWEIPSKYFIETLLRYCGTEKQIKDKKQKDRYFVEMCDHKASNQFGIWTHAEVRVQNNYDSDGNLVPMALVPTERGAEFMAKSCRLVTYYDPQGTHVPNKRDGEVRDIRRLLEHLGIPTRLNDRFHDFGMSLSDGEGNLTMNQEAADRDQRLLEVIELVQSTASNALARISRLNRESVRVFANLLTYNNLNPQKFNTSTQFTRTGLDISKLRLETSFMARVYKGTHWQRTVRYVVAELLKTINAETVLPKDIKATLPGICFNARTYEGVLRIVQARLANGRDNVAVIDALNVILRPLCSGGTVLNLARQGSQQQNFQVALLQDLRFEIGKSHRVGLSGREGMQDSLDGHSGGGFVPLRGFRQPLSPSLKTSNTSVQLNLHDELVSRMQDQGIPMMGGISGTTRDIFATLHSLFVNRSNDYWAFFSVVAAFMIKHHYHSLVECFIAAYQLRKTGTTALPCRTAQDFYRTIQMLTGVTFLEA